MRAWLSKLLPSGRPEVSSVPLGVPAVEPLRWHASISETRRILGNAGALALDLEGRPTARVRAEGRTVRARLEFEDGHPIGDGVWLPRVPGADLYDRSGTRTGVKPRLRGAEVRFEDRNPRSNWKWTLALLGRPTERARDGSWRWTWPLTTAQYVEAVPGDEQGAFLRLAATADSELLEVVNRSSFELFTELSVRVHFGLGAWATGDRALLPGVPTRLHWYVPRGERLKVTAAVRDHVVTADVFARARTVVITNDGRGGVRVVA